MMERKLYSVPEIEIVYLEDDVITSSGYTEDEEYTGLPEVGEDLFG